MLLIHETLHQLKVFSRRPVSVFLSIVLPLILLVMFVELFGNDPVPDTGVTTVQFYSPALAVFGAVSACYNYLAISTASAREAGVLKRIRGTPLPPLLYIAARILAASLLALTSVAVVVSAGIVFYGIQIFWPKLPGGLAVLVVGTMCFSALGMMVVALCRSSEMVEAVTSATLLPLAFISGIFIRPFREQPDWVRWISEVFPLKHFANGFTGMFRPGLEGHGLVWTGDEATYAVLPELAVMAAWGLTAALIASKFFRWDAQAG